ncbi:acyltransferase [Bradyrhizobium sp. CCBAU 51753]|uniref:acyltransferase family protein n=1 Tax=Bradyrhizobium sp. CCBAU 51753 TaxID=1325100 RepID=UPI00188AB781|nr:acyltransferase [Bradyrhizobium sp. CCBAU 51753]QOZ27266.1 hypothetical protein XH93_29355 [Bradyrhizobium sp. CCBAU 51753]
MKRLGYLDSIRGVAALLVAIAHLALVDDALGFEIKYVGVLRAPDFAVDLFFVLSGFVLFYQLQTERPSYLVFVARRFLRLFPPCIIAVLASYAIYLHLAPAAIQHLTPWFREVSWPPGITFDQFLVHLTLSNPLNLLLPPLWSLVYEWRVSIVFPLVVVAFLNAPKLVSVVVLGLTVMVAETSFWQQSQFDWILSTTFYGSFFLAGAAIARYQTAITDFLGRWAVLRYAIFATVFYWVSVKPQMSGYENYLRMGVMAALFIAATVSDPLLQAVLSVRPLLFLGRISYSLYLWHFIVIGVLFRALDGFNPVLIAALCLIVSVLVAVLMHRLVEVPSIKMGRAVSRWRPAVA